MADVMVDTERAMSPLPPTNENDPLGSGRMWRKSLQDLVPNADSEGRPVDRGEDYIKAEIGPFSVESGGRVNDPEGPGLQLSFSTSPEPGHPSDIYAVSVRKDSTPLPEVSMSRTGPGGQAQVDVGEVTKRMVKAVNIWEAGAGVQTGVSELDRSPAIILQKVQARSAPIITVARGAVTK